MSWCLLLCDRFLEIVFFFFGQDIPIFNMISRICKQMAQGNTLSEYVVSVVFFGSKANLQSMQIASMLSKNPFARFRMTRFKEDLNLF